MGADRVAAGALADLHNVMQPGGDAVTSRFAGVCAGPGLDRFDLDPGQPGCQPGRVITGRWRSSGAAVTDRASGLVGYRDAPPSARALGDPVSQFLARFRGGGAESFDVARRTGCAQPGRQGHGEVDEASQRQTLWPRPRRTWSGWRYARPVCGRAGAETPGRSRTRVVVLGRRRAGFGWGRGGSG